MKYIIILFLLISWSLLAQEDSYNDSDYGNQEDAESFQNKAEINNNTEYQDEDEESDQRDYNQDYAREDSGYKEKVRDSYEEPYLQEPAREEVEREQAEERETYED
jgi:hypothetical protein